MQLTDEAVRDLNEKFKSYTTICNVSLFYPNAASGHKDELSYLFLGLAGETGESVDLIKKYIRSGMVHKDQLTLGDVYKLKLELGDILWYIAQINRVLDFQLGDLLQENIKKLNARHEKDLSQTVLIADKEVK